jgi:hypothetical protein
MTVHRIGPGLLGKSGSGNSTAPTKAKMNFSRLVIVYPLNLEHCGQKHEQDTADVFQCGGCGG